jgi:hypothetical protein
MFKILFFFPRPGSQRRADMTVCLQFNMVNMAAHVRLRYARADMICGLTALLPVM